MVSSFFLEELDLEHHDFLTWLKFLYNELILTNMH